MAAKQPGDGGGPMSPRLRQSLIAYLLTMGVFLVYSLLRLNALDFADVALAVEAPRPVPASGPASPAPPPPASQGPTPAAPPAAGSTPATPATTARPVLIDAFPHLRMDPTPAYELALYGSGFVEKSQVRLNGDARPPKATPRDDLIHVVPLPRDFVGSGVLVVDVLNPDGAVSNALVLKIDRPKALLRLFIREWTVTREMQLLLMVLFAGALGSLVHAVQSLADFIGNRTAITSWFWWYITRPFLGGALAFIVYAVVRGGFLTGSAADARIINPFGAIAVAALVGMFADKATQKLAELFDTLFKTTDTRGGKLAAPVIDRLDPPTVVTGTQTPVVVKIVGDRLGAARTVKIDGRESTPDTISDKEVAVSLEPAEIAASGQLSISVVTADSTSPSVTLFVSDLAITTKALPSGKVGEEFPALTLAASGGTEPYGWAMAGLPAGLKIDAATGAISGKPTKAGDAKTVATVTDAAGASATQELAVQVA